MSPRILGLTIRDRREDIGITLQQFATATRLSLGFLRMLESGQTVVTLDAFFAIAEALGCRPFQLLLLAEMRATAEQAAAEKVVSP